MPNRLQHETSPYLRQHADNPVDWYPWGEEAFAAARAQDKPILLSIGYAACHWCHVMAHESFEDAKTAAFMNEHFINVKVDREERPDVDDIYMQATLLFNRGNGGWPMTVFLTPDGHPFHAGTYYPPEPRYGMPSFQQVMEAVVETFRKKRGEVERTGRALAEELGRAMSAGLGGEPELLSPAILDAAAQEMLRHTDPVHGGLTRGKPKFPNPITLEYLLRYYAATGHEPAREVALFTLRKMAAGGIYDQLGGGFHRYSVDEKWLVPHFEKMLYDNALLALAYLEGYQATGRDDFARVVRETLRFLERDMTSPEGAFCSATDADSPGEGGRREEGAFFTWTPAEIEAALGPERARIVCRYFGVAPGGNFEGRSILHAPASTEDVAREFGIPEAELAAVVAEAKEDLYRARSRRPAPIRDEKVLTAWNGLAVSAHARAGAVLGDPRYVERGCRAARFLLANSFRDGRLCRTWKDGEAGRPGLLDDHAFLVAGLLDLYEAAADISWLEKAVALDAVIEDRFEDKAGGGFFLAGDGGEELLVREKPLYDGAEPSGASVAVLNLLRLHEFTEKPRYRERAERALRYAAPTLAGNPLSLSEMLLALDFFLDEPKQVVVVLPRDGGMEEAASLLSALHGVFAPNRTLSVVREGAEQEKAARIVPAAGGKTAAGGRATAYVCEGRACMAPTADPDELKAQVRSVRRLPPAPAPRQAP